MRLNVFLKKILPAVVSAGLIFSRASAFSSADSFPRNLNIGMRGEDVRELQIILNRDIETQVSVSGFGSAGNETDYFGSATKMAVMKFQKKYRDDVLVPAGLLSGTGIFGPKTRAKLASLLKISESPVVRENSDVLSVPALIQAGQAISALPIRIKIPSIIIDAAIEHKGVTPDGEMDVPKGPATVSWFNLGPKPGDKGSAVISGHYGWKNGIPAVFDNLYKLKPGDKLYIDNEKGETMTFVVRELRRYGEHQNAADIFSSDDGKSHLNLITCEGVWNAASKSYSKRLIVFTDKE